MKIVRSLLAVTVFFAAFDAINTALAAGGIISKQELTPDSYCHLKLPAIREDTLGTWAYSARRSELRRQHRILWAV
jgi:hypothetical protein